VCTILFRIFATRFGTSGAISASRPLLCSYSRWASARTLIGSTLRLAAAGIVLGGLASVGATRLIGSMLFGVEPGDLYTFAAMVVVLGTVASAAGYFPARRASRTDPISALRAS